ncbi:transposase [Mesorhizobium sp. M9A.F.Ca.ET.002.03.1.2]|uniref:transposase n=1 Tax=Mesorhizobium sp. M9A.F.Ca.ET.002.03.1.2 TaxID=2493668 RepID=UPI001AECBBDA|nr:transposase [Mesorhizobium sp. M9A.F.Ca.ET.002.03.1.2]
MGFIEGVDRGQAALLPPCLIIHHDVFNDANDGHLLHPMSTGARHVLNANELHVLTDGGYSNAEEVARCERGAITVSAPIKRGAMNSEHFRPTQFVYDEPATPSAAPQAKHSDRRESTPAIRAIRYRTSACKACALKPKCTPGVQRTIHRLFDQAALDRMEARIYADPNLMRIRRCTVEHPFGTIKRMSGGGRFLTRGLRAVKAEAALSILAFNVLHAVNAFGQRKMIGGA